MQIVEILSWAKEQYKLLSQNTQLITLDLEVLLAFVIQKPRAYLKTWPKHNLSCEDVEKFKKLFDRYAHGEPLPYLIGDKSFWDINLLVSNDVLIPRADTEVIVDKALDKIPQGKPVNILDLGTGSGAIALSIAHSRPLANVIATDLSYKAILIAKKNAQNLGINNVNFVVSDWLLALKSNTSMKFDMILSNPPYIAANDPHLLQEIRFEPQSALVSGNTGLNALTVIIDSVYPYIKLNGWCMVEHGFTQGDVVRNKFYNNNFSKVVTYKDFSNKDRVTVGCKIFE